MSPGVRGLAPRSLQGRLLGLVLAGVVAIWIGVAASLWIDVRHELDELLDAHLAQAAALLVVQHGSLPDDDDEVSPDAPTLHRYARKVAFQVFHDGRMVMRSANAPATPLREPDDHDDRGFGDATIEGVTWRTFVARGAEADVRVVVAEEGASRSDILRAMLRGALAPLTVALPLLALAVWIAVRQGTAPLRRLGEQLARRAPDDLRPVALDDAPQEMQPMLDALAALFARIERLLQGERRFTADAAHELRTPIAAIRAQAQVAIAEADDARRRQALAALLAGCDRATRLVEQMLTLARLEAAPAASPATPVDLAALARRVVAEAAGPALAKSQALEVDAPAPVALAADETLLAVLLRNLVDNAIRYAPAQAAVRVAVGVAGGRPQLVVEDGGPGLAADECRRLGERFFRVLGTGESGSGLGWSIVRRIAEVQGAAVEVDRSPALGGLRVAVRWPAGAR